MKAGYSEAAWRLFQPSLAVRRGRNGVLTWADTELAGTPFGRPVPLPVVRIRVQRSSARARSDHPFESQRRLGHTPSFMTTTVVVLLGVMALASVTQAVFLIVLAVEGRRLAQRVDAFQARIGGEMRPILSEITRATENLAGASSAIAGQARRVDVMMTEVTTRLSDTQGLFRNLIVPVFVGSCP